MKRSHFSYSAIALVLCLGAAYVLPRTGLRLPISHERPDGPRHHLVPILCFHNVDGEGPYSVSRAEFYEYMRQIREQGITVISLRTLVEHARVGRLFTQPVLVITVDDDYKNIVRVAAPILREFRYPATFFFYTKDIQGDPRWGTSWDDLRRLQGEGFDIQNHSYTHTMFHHPRAGESEERYAVRVLKEIRTSREILRRELGGSAVYAFAYPMGFHSPDLRRRLEAEGYDVLLTTDARPVNLTRPFRGSFDRYTIQKRYVRNPAAMFRRQLQYALQAYDETRVAGLSADEVNDDGEEPGAL